MKGAGRYKFRIALALVVAFGGLGAVLATDARPNLGLDLQGGTSVILTATGEEGVSSDVLEKTVTIIRERIDALGVAEPEVTTAGGENILIQLPGVEDEARALEIVGSTAQLTFRQVLEAMPREGAPEEEQPEEGDEEQPEEDEGPPEVTEEKGSEVNNEEVIYPDAENDNQLYRLAPAEGLTGDIITRAEAIVDPSGNWTVTLRMNRQGSERWAELTSELACLRDEGEQIRSQVAIVLDGRVETATGMRDPAEAGAGGGVECGQGITGGESQIDVGTQDEARDLALVLRTGALPLTLEQSEVNKISATLGHDSLQAGVTAGLLGLGLVMLYVLIYYRALGLVVWLGLAVFSATIFALISILGETAGLSLTLAGIAGIIVSIGITTDSYIVAFERLKDEIRSGKTMRAAVDKGMKRSFRTILIADFVTASAAVILFFLAVGPVRGFALTLGLATAVDVLVAYFFTRSAVHLLARTRFFSEGRFIGIREALGVQG